MSGNSQLTYEQWRTYFPFLYNFYLKHNELRFNNVICSKWCKEQNIAKPNLCSFIIAGSQQVQHTVQGVHYTLTQWLIKSYDIIIPQINDQNQLGSKPSQSHKRNSETKIPAIIENQKIFYQKQITFVEDIVINKKKAIQYQTSTSFYAVALKNQSIRILNAKKMSGRQVPKRITFFTQRSPFLLKNIKETKYCMGNLNQAGLVPLQKEVTVMKYNSIEQSLLCGCSDGTIVMINLKYQIISNDDNISNAYVYFTTHKRCVRDVQWMYSTDERFSFASVSDDRAFYIWNKQITNAPVEYVDQGNILPTSLIEVQKDQYILGGREHVLKFFDLKRRHSYIYEDCNEIITKLYNLTGQLEYQNSKKQTGLDKSLRFVACEQSGKIVFWQGQKEFEHLAHKGRIASIDFIPQFGGLFLAIEKESANMSIFSPILFTSCLEDVIQ